MVSKLADQTFITVNAIIGAGLLAIIAAFIGYVWPRVKDEVNHNKQKVFDELGKHFADEGRHAVAGKKTSKQIWEALAAYNAKTIKESLESAPKIDSAERPLSALRDAVYALIVSSLSFLAAVGVALSAYEFWSGLISFIGGVFLLYFFYRVAVLWHDLSK
jgi:hypothetical protein